MNDETSWRTMPASVVPADGAVHVWRIRLAHLPDCVERLAQNLSEDERERAARFRYPRDRMRFIAARAALRHILARALQGGRTHLRFSYGPKGKPLLAGSDVTFNLSHAEDLALCAVTLRRAVGVDIEKIAPLKQPGIIDRVFSPHQAQMLRALPEPVRWEGFHAGWTRKEAYVKAHGEGLNFPLGSFDVSLDGRDDMLRDALGEVWTVRGIAPAEGFAGAVAASGDGFTLACWDWDQGCGCRA